MRQIKLKKIVAATALALSSAVLMSPAYAAGLGRLTVMSGLGQPLKAEIDLTSVSRDEASSLVARLASPAAYRQAGVEFNASLLNVRMAVERRADGQYFVRLSSNQPVNDPIVDVLVELTWSNGRLLREYTFLLDPVDMKPMQAPVAPPAAPAPKPAPTQAPVATPAIPAAPMATPSPVRPAAQPKAATATGSYEVKKGDTLGKIARQSQSDGLTLDQMLVALQRANQDAFVGGNVNRLKSGVILTIPDKEAAAAVAPSDARRLIAAQSADWKAYQEKVAGGVQAAPAEKPAVAKQEAKGKITARVEDKAGAGTAADKLKLSKADPAALAKGGAAKPKANEEDRISKERELRDTKSRQTELERNVKDLQKLAEIKNQGLADLQKGAQAKGAQPQIAQGPVTPPPAPVKAAEAAKVEPPKTVAPPAAPKAPEPPKAVAVPAAPAKAPEPPKAPEASKATEAPKAAAPVLAKSTEPAKAAEPAKPADAPKADAPKVEAKAAAKKVAPPPPPEPSLVDEFLGNPMYLAGGGGVLALLGGYAAYAVRRKRKEANTGFESSIITGGDLKANSVFGNTGGQSVDTGNSSFQSDFSAVGSSAVDTDEVDPVAEADVYMAYGRDAQAEEILKEALEKDSTRQTVRLKLLEIYSQRGDANSFGTTAAVLHSATGGQGPDWERAAALGQQVDPANSLYGGAAAAVNAGGNSVSTVALGGGALAAAAAAAASANDKTVTLPAFGAPGGAPLAADDPMTKTVALEALQGKTPASIDLDFDLGSDTQEAPPAKPDVALESTVTAKAAPSIDFDLGFGDAPTEAPAAVAPAAAEPDTDFAPGGTLIIDAPPAMGEAPVSADKTMELSGMASVSLAAPSDAGMSVDFDFDLGSSDPAPAAPAPAPAAPAGNSVDFDFGSISLDLPDTGASAPPAAADDVATKLDLAKAYQEMGDKDGAKELLKEVVAEGSDAQKSEAQKLLAELG